MATNLETLQATYTQLVNNLAEVLANPRPNYSIDGVSLDFGAYYELLMSKLERLRMIPGVAPPDIIDLVSVGRG